MSCCVASAWVALLSIAKMNCLMMMLGLQCCLLRRDVCTACFWADVCGLTFGSVGERGSFGRYLRELPAPSVAMGRCLVALLVLGWHWCPLQKSCFMKVLGLQCCLLTVYKGSTHHLLLDRSAVSQGTVALHHASA